MKRNVGNLFGILAILSFVFLFQCGPKKRKVEESTDAYAKLNGLALPSFNADSAYQYVADQVAFGPRVPNTEPHRKCADYLLKQLMKNGWVVTTQAFTMPSYDGTSMNLRNIVASYRPEEKRRILLVAHWDTRHVADNDTARTKEPIPGANDGASGVAVLLEIARVIHLDTLKPTVGIDILLLDGEDHGQPDNSGFPEKENTWCLGSQYWSKTKHQPGYAAYYGILLDMVGGRNARFAMDGVSMKYAPDIMKKVWDIGNRLGYSAHFVYTTSESFIDDHYYINQIAHIPTIDIIEYDNSDGIYFNNHWHTHHDNLENIDKNTLKAVGQTLLGVLYLEQ